MTIPLSACADLAIILTATSACKMRRRIHHARASTGRQRFLRSTGDNDPCVCDEGYYSTGNDCLPIQNPCATANCGANANCVVTSKNQALCVCNEGYLHNGSSCVANPCVGVSCAGNGACIVTSAYQALCICDVGYRPGNGNECVPDVCSGVTCSEHGSCVVDASNQALCVCDEGYRLDSGNQCVADACFGVTCSDQGHCVVTPSNEALCVCNQGYISQGTLCQPNPCNNVTCGGKGSCVVTGSLKPMCVCNKGYRPVGASCVLDDACVTSSTCTDNWCLIPACTFQMGSPNDEGCRSNNEGPIHPVTITRPFWMKRTEVTQYEWEAVFPGTNPSMRQPYCAMCPVDNVNWYDAVRYADKLSATEGLSKCYSIGSCTGTPGSGEYTCDVTYLGPGCTGYRLPTEAEWEYATRAGTTTAYWMGSNVGYSGQPVCGNSSDGIGLPEAGWYSYNSAGKTQKVKDRLPNQWGLYDVHGNVSEWVNDRFDDHYNSCKNGCTDPLGPSTGNNRAYRGGSYLNNAGECRSAYRNSAIPTNGLSWVGFRLARSLP